jgi:large subunit ribosomal protein L4
LKSTKTRSEVQGGGKKPLKQKGTGNARKGSIRSPLHCGGGIIFGPKPNINKQKLNKKENNLALQTFIYNNRFNFIIFDKFNTCSNKIKLAELLLAFTKTKN